MAIEISRYRIATVAWGATQGAAATVSALVALTATGAGVWAAVDTHEAVRQGAFDFAVDIAANEVVHTLHVRYANTAWGTARLAFRLYDVTNSLAIATATPTGSTTSVSTTTFANLPAADARVELQYNLVAPTTCSFYVGLWDMYRWP